jgi:superfamily I DNA/RNA helicase
VAEETNVGWSDNISGVHREIAADPSPILHVLAGPGTGKTFALIRRIARLLETGVPPEKILAVSFTRTAARDLKDQLKNLGIIGAEQVRTSTLHSLCYSILKLEAVFSVTNRDPRPLLTHEQNQLINDLAKSFGGKRKFRMLLEAYEAGWARLQREPVGPPTDHSDQEFEVAFLKWMGYHRCMLIGELVPLTLGYVRQNPALDFLPQFDYVLVDEYQDLNRADQELVKELGRRGATMVIGDDNQSIYSFRYANPDGILNFPSENKNTKSYVIEECRRCPSNIVEMSNALIRHNPGKTRELKSLPGRPPAAVYIVQHRTVSEEIEATADFIHTYLNHHPSIQPGQVLVLTTRRFIGHGIKHALISRSRNALSYFFEDELEKPTAAEGLCLLNLLVNPSDRAALRAWIGLGEGNNGSSAGYARILSYAQNKELDLKDVLDRLINGALTLPYCDKISERYAILNSRLGIIKDLKGLDLVKALWSPDDTESSDIRILASNMAVENSEPVALYTALLREITQPELPGSGGDIIRVMSLHKSKGLTAALVVIAGCVSGALPTIDKNGEPAFQDAQRVEQRRLFYVAITRSTECLVISSSIYIPKKEALPNGIDVQRYRFIGPTLMACVSPSPFINELGPAAPKPINTQQWREQAGF